MPKLLRQGRLCGVHNPKSHLLRNNGSYGHDDNGCEGLDTSQHPNHWFNPMIRMFIIFNGN